MAIIDRLATSLGRKDEIANTVLAEELAKKKDEKDIKELIVLLSHKDKNIQSDAIKVLYEIGEKNAALIAGYDKVFLSLLKHKNNRMIWGAMAALDTISAIRPKEIYAHLTEILDVAATGSVITRDHAVNILINLAKVKTYTKDALTLLFAELSACPINQLPMYAERMAPVVSKDMQTKFRKVLEMRLEDVEQESKRKRIEKVLKKIVK